MTDWWRALEDELEQRGIDAPDPWPSADEPSEELALTADQRAFLEQVTSTPVLEVDELADDELANDRADDQ